MVLSTAAKESLVSACVLGSEKSDVASAYRRAMGLDSCEYVSGFSRPVTLSLPAPASSRLERPRRPGFSATTFILLRAMSETRRCSRGGQLLRTGGNRDCVREHRRAGASACGSIGLVR